MTTTVMNVMLMGDANAPNKSQKIIMDVLKDVDCAFALIDDIAAMVYKRSRPVAAVHGDPQWRRTMAAITTKRALITLREG